MFENGNDNEEITPDPASQTGRVAKTSKYFAKLFLEFLFCKNLEIPNIPPKLQNNIPPSKVKCGGLSNPSRPKLECHTKSNGPAPTSKKIPRNFSLSGNLKTSLESCRFLYPKSEIADPISPIATPEYIIACGGEKNVSGLFSK